jgi:hypothetical protein
MIVIVCGGRDFTDGVFAFDQLDRLRIELGIDVVIEGGQRTKDRFGSIIGGADYWAARWARARKISHHTERADWRRFGRAAGPIRNKKMLTDHRPARLIAFVGGDGTADAMAQARQMGIAVIEIKKALRW